MMEILIYILVGFAAQMIDGTLGMGYGVSSTMFLLSIGVAPAAASASVHTAKTATTLVSGLAHLHLGNVEKRLLIALVISGVLGGILGAALLSNLQWDFLQPLISIYLLLMGVRILAKGFQTSLIEPVNLSSKVYPLGFIGGFMDSIGGGGWGPIVTTTLVADGNQAHKAIGTVSLAEFFVSVAQVATFTIFLKLTHIQVILGLIIGGVVAAPLAAYICRKVNTRVLMVIVGVLIILLSLRTIWMYFAG
jgi:uncharacterized protein